MLIRCNFDYSVLSINKSYCIITWYCNIHSAGRKPQWVGFICFTSDSEWFSISAFDMRVSPTEDFPALKSKLLLWCEEAGKDVSLDFLQVNMF